MGAGAPGYELPCLELPRWTVCGLAVVTWGQLCTEGGKVRPCESACRWAQS